MAESSAGMRRLSSRHEGKRQWRNHQVHGLPEGTKDYHRNWCGSDLPIGRTLLVESYEFFESVRSDAHKKTIFLQP